MARGRRVAKGLLAGAAVLALLAVVVLLVFTNTPWGREQVRQVVLEQLEPVVDGEVAIGRVEGNLLRGIRLRDVSIADAEGRPFLEASTFSTGFSMAGLLRRRVVLTDVELGHAHVVLDDPPGEEWNFVRIFQLDPEAEPDPGAGWGDWIDLRDIRLTDSRVTIRTEWEPEEAGTPAERQEAVREALEGETRLRVEEVPGGLQQVMDFREIDAHLPRVLAAHPDRDEIPIEVASARMAAELFRPPAAAVDDLSADFRVANGMFYIDRLQLALPGSRLAGAGVLHTETGELVLELEARPIDFTDLRFLRPEIPDALDGSLRLDLHVRETRTRAVVEALDLRVGEGRAEGRVDVTVGDSLRVGDTELRFLGIESGMLEALLPELELPPQLARAPHFSFSGRIAAESLEPAEAGAGATDPSRPAAAPGTPLVRLDAVLEIEDGSGPPSRVLAEGVLGVGDALHAHGLTLRLDPLRTGLVRAAAPDFPVRGTVEGFAVLNGPIQGPLHVESVLSHQDPVAGRSRVSITGGVDTRDALRLSSVQVRLEPLQMDLLAGVEPIPSGSTLTGSLLLDGAPSGMLRVDSDLVLEDPASGTSRIATSGEVGAAAGPAPRAGAAGPAGPAGPAFRDFRLDLEPLQMGVLAAALPDLPLGGTLEGIVRLDGVPSHGVALAMDLLHVEGGERSRVEGEAELVRAEAGRVSGEIRLRELSLVTAGRFVPEAGLRGSISGPVEVEGTLEDLALRELTLGARLELPDGGGLDAEGTLAFVDDEPEYDLTLDLRNVNLFALSDRVPDTTALGGSLSVRGWGTDLRTLRARLAADVENEDPEEPADVRVLRGSVEVSEGVVHADPLVARMGAAELEARGGFGLTADQEGEMTYRLTADSLHVLAPFLPLEPGAVEPRPAVREAAVETVRSELLEAARAAEVEFLATGRRPDLPEPEDVIGVAGIRTDALGGSAHASGVLRGNVERFDVVGALEVRELLLMGHYLGGGSVDHALHGAGTPALRAEVDARAHGVLVAGFAYDSLAVQAEYEGRPPVANGEEEAPRPNDHARAPEAGAGRARLELYQDAHTHHSTELAFDLAPEMSELRLDALVLRFEDALYRMTEPAAVRWSEDALEVEALRLESRRGALLRADGRIPREGRGEAELLLEDFEIAHLVTLLQEAEGPGGRVSLHLPVSGTLAAPVFEGEGSATSLTLDDAALPDARIAVAYAERELRAEASLHAATGAAEPWFSLEASIPVDLALVDPQEPRMPDAPMRVEAALHDMPVEVLAGLTDQVVGARGRIAGQLSVGGTVRDPEVEGALDLDVPSVFVVPLGVRVTGISGALSLREGVMTVDSLVARSGGPLRVSGEVDVRTPSEPAFDLVIEARETRIIDTEEAEMEVDLDLTVTGPFDDVRVQGEARTRHGVIRIPTTRALTAEGPLDLDDPAIFERVDEALTALRDELVESPPILENLRVELALHVDRDVWLRSQEANIEIYTPVEIGPLSVVLHGIEADDVVLGGTIHTERGEYEFMGRRFSLSRGAVTFTGETEIDPIIRITAEHEVQLPGREAFDIQVILDGRLSELETTVESTSQPPLSQTDLLSFLVFGRDAGSLFQQGGSSLTGQGAGGGPLVGNVAARATQQLTAVAMDALVTELEGETARALALDVLRIQPTDAPAELFAGRLGDLLRGTEIEAGRYVTPRLFLAAQARPTLVHPGAQMEYLMGDGYLWEVSWRPRFLPAVPTLGDFPPDRASVFGSFLFREWRF